MSTITPSLVLGFTVVGGLRGCGCLRVRIQLVRAVPLLVELVTGGGCLVAVGGGLLLQTGAMPKTLSRPVAILAALLVAITGAIGVYHAGVEWHVFAGPRACTGAPVQISGALDLNAHVVSCDHAAWRLFGISMAGYNALISLGAAAIGFALLAKKENQA